MCHYNRRASCQTRPLSNALHKECSHTWLKFTAQLEHTVTMMQESGSGQTTSQVHSCSDYGHLFSSTLLHYNNVNTSDKLLDLNESSFVCNVVQPNCQCNCRIVKCTLEIMANVCLEYFCWSICVSLTQLLQTHELYHSQTTELLLFERFRPNNVLVVKSMCWQPLHFYRVARFFFFLSWHICWNGIMEGKGREVHSDAAVREVRKNSLLKSRSSHLSAVLHLIKSGLWDYMPLKVNNIFFQRTR